MATSAKKRDPLYELCRKLPGVTEDVKWEKDLVFSVGGKMFAAFQLPEGEPVGVKVGARGGKAAEKGAGLAWSRVRSDEPQ